MTPFAKARQYGKVEVGRVILSSGMLGMSPGQLLHLLSLDLSFLIPVPQTLGLWVFLPISSPPCPVGAEFEIICLV